VAWRLISPASPTFFAGTQPQNLGVNGGILTLCPETPNCVNSQTKEGIHAIAPLTYTGSETEAFNRLKEIIAAEPRTVIVTERPNYLYAQFTSQWLGFVDDVEFYFNPNEQTIDVRSASRLGESDLDVNRQRVEKIRSLLDA
jgi:uncharacterized protein (DUF1499 family)